MPAQTIKAHTVMGAGSITCHSTRSALEGKGKGVREKGMHSSCRQNHEVLLV